MKEIIGVSLDVIEWTDFIYNIIIKHGVITFIKLVSTGELKTVCEIDNKNVNVYSGTISITGQKFDNLIRRHISKDNELKLRNVSLILDFTLIDESEWSLDFFNGCHSDIKSNFIDDKLEDVEIYFDIYIPKNILEIKNNIKNIDKFFNDYSIRTKIFEMISHEFDHALEFFHRKDKAQNIFPEKLLNFLIYLNKNLKLTEISNDWQHFLNLCYLNLSFEQNARITQLYYSINEYDIKNTDEYWYYIKETEVWKELIDLKNFNSLNFYNKFKFDADENELIESFRITGLFSEKEIEDNDIKKLVLIMLIRQWNETIDQVNKEYKKFGNVKLEKISNSLLTEPIKFLNSYERKFHKNWNKFYNKVIRLSVSLLDINSD